VPTEGRGIRRRGGRLQQRLAAQPRGPPPVRRSAEPWRRADAQQAGSRRV